MQTKLYLGLYVHGIRVYIYHFRYLVFKANYCCQWTIVQNYLTSFFIFYATKSKKSHWRCCVLTVIIKKTVFNYLPQIIYHLYPQGAGCKPHLAGKNMQITKRDWSFMQKNNWKSFQACHKKRRPRKYWRMCLHAALIPGNPNRALDFLGGSWQTTALQTQSSILQTRGNRPLLHDFIFLSIYCHELWLSGKPNRHLSNFHLSMKQTRHRLSQMVTHSVDCDHNSDTTWVGELISVGELRT